MYRHVTKTYIEATKSVCTYCHKTPALWHYVGNEKICVHCGTRVYNSAALMPNDNSGARIFKAQ